MLCVKDPDAANGVRSAWRGARAAHFLGSKPSARIATFSSLASIVPGRREKQREAQSSSVRAIQSGVKIAAKSVSKLAPKKGSFYQKLTWSRAAF